MNEIKITIPDDLINDCNSFSASLEFIKELKDLVLEECEIQFYKIIGQTKK
jgi:hypothetical protein